MATTIIALATKDVIVMGSDSLSTASRRLIDPMRLLDHFDPKTLELKENTTLHFQDIYSNSEDIPFSHMAHVDKLFQLHKNVGVALSGLVSIGNITLKSIIQEVMTNEYKPCREAAQNLKEKIQAPYEKQYKNYYKPPIELLVAGWNSNNNRPLIYRINFPEGKIRKGIDGDYGISFGGQYKEISRLVHGTDPDNMHLIEERHQNLLQHFVTELKQLNPNGLVWPSSKFLKQFRMFGLENPNDSNSGNWRLDRFDASVDDFSDQNAINCVSWLIELMIKAQEFSNSMPTVGGNIHVAIIDRKDGFRFVSQESYNFQGHTIPKNQEEAINADAKKRNGEKPLHECGANSETSKDVS